METIPTTFTCSRCGAIKPAQISGGTAYAQDHATGKVMTCYACCADVDREFMVKEGRIFLYLAGDNASGFKACNWPGTLVFPVRHTRHSQNNWRVQRTDAWFVGPDGREWHGVNLGDSQILRCRRNKR